MIAQRGRIERAEMEKTFNMGVGMVAVVALEDTDRALAILTARHLDCWTLGTVDKAPNKGSDGPRAKMVGQHPVALTAVNGPGRISSAQSNPRC